MADICKDCENIYIKLYKLTAEIRRLQKKSKIQNFYLVEAKKKEIELDKHLEKVKTLLIQNKLI